MSQASKMERIIKLEKQNIELDREIIRAEKRISGLKNQHVANFRQIKSLYKKGQFKDVPSEYSDYSLSSGKYFYDY